MQGGDPATLRDLAEMLKKIEKARVRSIERARLPPNSCVYYVTVVTMAANKFVLKGSGVEVEYTIGATPSLPTLVYKAGAFHKSFKPAEIVSEGPVLECPSL
jgi:hypothetical protein